MTNGDKVRINRIMDRKTKTTVIIPMDHGIGEGAMSGLEKPKEVIDDAAQYGANAVVGHLGIVKWAHRDKEGSGKDIGLILHYSGSSPDNLYSQTKQRSLRKEILYGGNLDLALHMGADAISVHINLENEHSNYMLKECSKIAAQAYMKNIPLMAMMYVRNIESGTMKNSVDSKNVANAAAVAADMGADLIKVSYCQGLDKVVEAARGIPVIIAGGSKSDDYQVIETIVDAMSAGARGVACGRNVFQHKNRPGIIGAISDVVHGWYGKNGYKNQHERKALKINDILAKHKLGEYVTKKRK